ncbi:MAG: hypothetical protein KBH07_05155 [Flavobacteriales bacterium]|nr:hypothetical protein [Flavobacteriales bacterium]MBP9079420.1 hypothetical protein [Flavobacteriales bacterium]
MHTAQGFRFGFLGMALALLGAGAMHQAWPPLARSAVVGTYQRIEPLLLPVGRTPQQVVLHANGTMELAGLPDKGTVVHPWQWDPQERVVRTNDPAWDRRIRLRSTWRGPRLCLRICDTPLLQDQEERDEEVDYIRVPARKDP